MMKKANSTSCPSDSSEEFYDKFVQKATERFDVTEEEAFRLAKYYEENHMPRYRFTTYTKEYLELAALLISVILGLLMILFPIQ